MAIRGAKSIAEYAIRKWLEQEGFAVEHFELVFNKNEAIVMDSEGQSIRLVYDPAYKTVILQDA